MPGWDPGRAALDETIGSDRLISLTRTDEPRRYFSLDGLRSVVNLTDDDGLEVASYHLDAWGNFRFPTELNDSANRFAFTGHIFDTETGLYNAKARYFDPKLGRFLTQDSFLGRIDNPPTLHRYFYAAQNPTRYIDPTGHEFTLNKDKAYGPNGVATPVLSEKFSHEEYQQYLSYVEKHGSRDQVVAATLGAAGTYATAYGKEIAKMEAAGAAGVVAATPVALAGGGAVVAGAVGGATQGFVSGLLDQVSAKALAARTATGAVLGAAFGWVAQRVGAFIAGEASPSVPGAGKTDTVAMQPVSGQAPPRASAPTAVPDEVLPPPASQAGAALADDVVPLGGGADTARTLSYQHQLKAGKTTDVPALEAQIGQEVDTMNAIIKAEGIEGLQQRILAYRADPTIEAAGRAHVKTLGPAGCTECGDPLAWIHRLDMSKGGAATDIAGKGLLRNNSIIGGQSNRIADEILKMPPGTTRIQWELTLKPVRVKSSP